MNLDQTHNSIINRCLLLFISAFFLHMGISAQNYKGQIIFNGSSLEEKNDTLYMHCEVLVQSGAVSSCNSMRITPVLTTGSPSDSTHYFPHILIQGNSKRQDSDRAKALNNKNKRQENPYMVVNVKEETDTLLHYKMQLPYELWMDSAYLVVHQELTGCRNESRVFSFSMNNKIEFQSREPFQPDLFVSFMEPLAEEKRRQKQGQAFLDFQVGRSQIVPTYRRNPEELAKIKDALKEVTENPDVQIKGLFIEGYASPDGKYSTNERLSGERATALKEYMKKSFGFEERFIKVNNVAEDWEGLTALVQESDITKKEQILGIITSISDNDVKESKLKQLDNGVIYRKMLKDMFPQLRRVEYQIDYSVKDYSTTEAKALIGKNDEQLSHLEMYRVAQSYGEGSKEFEEIILERIPKYFPDNLATINNAAVLLIRKGETAAARRFIDRLKYKRLTAEDFKKIKDSQNFNRAQEEILFASIMNNMGVIEMLIGQLDEADKIFSIAAYMGNKEAVHNSEQLRLKREDNIKQERYKK